MRNANEFQNPSFKRTDKRMRNANEFQNPSFKRTDKRTFERDGIYVAMFLYFGYLCGYLPMCGLNTQESILATKVSNLRNKSHLYSKMTTCVSNCPNFIATRVPIGLYAQTDKPKAICSPLFQSWGHNYKMILNHTRH